ncbi:MAG: GNAT family N-acetyltransferase [Finegoldia sp.]|nr:GNAT family N-acetyltransferase [Finegoldia sp.]
MVDVVYEGEKSRAAAYDGEKIVGESTYSDSGKIWIIDHTQVSDGYQGRGIAGRLVEELVNKAREAGVKIIPLCPFAKKEFEKHKEYEDVWEK